MFEKYDLNLTGKIFEILNRSDQSFIRVKLYPFDIQVPSPKHSDFHLEDEIEINVRIEILQINQKNNFNNHKSNLEVQNE